MSLPVYNALSFQEILEKGGHSKPWVILININDTLKPYVVKLYKTEDIEARNKMTAEVLGNILAKDFGLKAPEPAIINFTEDFRMSLNVESEHILSDIDERPKFGCEFIEGANLFSPETDRHTTNDIIDTALLYAYDYFICNRDRNFTKPNLLVKQQEGYLIDHEMALEISSEAKNNFLKEIWDSRYQNHLFYKSLKETRGDKSNLFDEFLLYLNSINFQKVEPFFYQLETLGFNTRKQLIIDYWTTIQKKSNRFKTILTRSIQ
jgi:predicted Ser/Thr protein kinase